MALTEMIMIVVTLVAIGVALAAFRRGKPALGRANPQITPQRDFEPTSHANPVNGGDGHLGAGLQLRG